MPFGFIAGVAKRTLSSYGGPVGAAIAEIIPGQVERAQPTLRRIAGTTRIVEEGLPELGSTMLCDPRDPSCIGTGMGMGLTRGNGCRPGESERCCRLRQGSWQEQRQYQEECMASVTGGFGEAVLGRFGAGLQPATRTVTSRICPRGAVLGVDGLCYNRREIRNSDRMWPRGRRPLLTGGEMRAISIAARAAGKVQRKKAQLEKMGMLQKARRGRKALPAARKEVIVEHGPGSVVG